MFNTNTFSGCGRLTKPATFPTDNIANIGLAFQGFPTKEVDDQGRKVYGVAFVDCKAFNPSILDAVEPLQKGAQVHVTGYLQTDFWKSKEGEDRSKLILYIEALTVVEERAEKPQGRGQQTQQAPQGRGQQQAPPASRGGRGGQYDAAPPQQQQTRGRSRPITPPPASDNPPAEDDDSVPY